MSAQALRPLRTNGYARWRLCVLLLPWVLVINFFVTWVTGCPDKGYVAGLIFMTVVGFPLAVRVADGR